MSDIPTDYKDRLDIREQIARIDRARAETEKLAEETRKYVQEAHKLQAERDKMAVEAMKLSSEQRKLERDRWLAPVLAVVTVIGGILGIASFIAKVVWG
jgi:FtsZ-binding cell division protein ZapB